MSRSVPVRLAFWLWLAAGAVTWNVTFDLLVTRGVKEYLRRNAEYHAGFRPPVTIDEIMRPTIRDAAASASLAALAVSGAGLGTIWLLRMRNADCRMRNDC